MSQKLSILESIRQCPVCKKHLNALPPCPICGSEFENFLNREQYETIIKFLKVHKGSQCRISLGKKDGSQVLIYDLKTKKQLMKDAKL